MIDCLLNRTLDHDILSGFDTFYTDLDDLEMEIFEEKETARVQATSCQLKRTTVPCNKSDLGYL